MQSSAIAIIPCFNVSDRCTAPILGAMQHVDAVLAVDDGSTDDTLQHIKSTGCLYLSSPRNEGKGKALQRAFEAVLKPGSGPVLREYEYIVTLDGDGQHIPSEIPKLLAAMQTKPCDLLIGVRDVTQMPPKSKIGNSISRTLFRFGLTVGIADTQSGFRILRTSALRDIFDEVTWGRYETEMDMLCKSAGMGYSIRTVPIQTVYFDNNKLTHFRPFMDSVKVMFTLARYALVGVLVSVVDMMCYAALVAYYPDRYIEANVWSRVASVATHFLLARSFAFRVRSKFRLKELVRYVGVVLFNVSMAAAGVAVLVEQFSLSPLMAKIIAQSALFLITFALLKLFVYETAGKAQHRGSDTKPTSEAEPERSKSRAVGIG